MTIQHIHCQNSTKILSKNRRKRQNRYSQHTHVPCLVQAHQWKVTGLNRFMDETPILVKWCSHEIQIGTICAYWSAWHIYCFIDWLTYCCLWFVCLFICFVVVECPVCSISAILMTRAGLPEFIKYKVSIGIALGTDILTTTSKQIVRSQLKSRKRLRVYAWGMETTLCSLSSQIYGHLCVWKSPLNSKLLGNTDCLH